MFAFVLQDIIPQSLLENYLGMVDPSRAQTVDTEITRHCAYNLPAVAYTLGRRNWHCIKHLYETLSQAMQVSRVSLLVQVFVISKWQRDQVLFGLPKTAA